MLVARIEALATLYKVIAGRKVGMGVAAEPKDLFGELEARMDAPFCGASRR
jgi:hypothetical protein